MGLFQSTRYFPVALADLTPVANDLMEHFRVQGYEVTGEPMVSRGWFVSVHKGGLFKAVLGMKTALNIELEPAGQGLSAKAGIGIFGMHVVPALIARFIFWPLLVPEIWGLVQQAKLDDAALEVVAKSVGTHAGGSLPGSTGPVTPIASPGETAGAKFCTSCGSELHGPARFCPACGAAIQS